MRVYVALGGWVRGSFISLCLVGSVVVVDVMDMMDMMDGGCCVVLRSVCGEGWRGRWRCPVMSTGIDTVSRYLST